MSGRLNPQPWSSKMWCEVEHNLLQGTYERWCLSPNWHQGKALVYWNEGEFGPVNLQDGSQGSKHFNSKSKIMMKVVQKTSVIICGYNCIPLNVQPNKYSSIPGMLQKRSWSKRVFLNTASIGTLGRMFLL